MSATTRGWQVSLLLHAALLGGFLLLNVGLQTVPRPVTIQLSFLAGQPAAAVAAPPPVPAVPEAKPAARTVPQTPKPAVQEQTEESAPLAAEQDQPAPAEPAEPTVEQTPTEAPPAVAATTGTREETAAEGPGASQAYVREHFAYIRNLVMRTLGYPPLAQRMGWSGRVVIVFTVLEDGTVSDMRVEESSGKKLLDDNALATVSRVAPFPPPPVPAEIVMPIAYRLN